MPDTAVVDEDMLADGGHWGVVLVDDAVIFGRGARSNVILPKPLVTALDKEPARRAASRCIDCPGRTGPASRRTSSSSPACRHKTGCQ